MVLLHYFCFYRHNCSSESRGNTRRWVCSCQLLFCPGIFSSRLCCSNENSEFTHQPTPPYLAIQHHTRHQHPIRRSTCTPGANYHSYWYTGVRLAGEWKTWLPVHLSTYKACSWYVMYVWCETGIYCVYVFLLFYWYHLCHSFFQTTGHLGETSMMFRGKITAMLDSVWLWHSTPWL